MRPVRTSGRSCSRPAKPLVEAVAPRSDARTQGRPCQRCAAALAAWVPQRHDGSGLRRGGTAEVGHCDATYRGVRVVVVDDDGWVVAVAHLPVAARVRRLAGSSAEAAPPVIGYALTVQPSRPLLNGQFVPPGPENEHQERGSPPCRQPEEALLTTLGNRSHGAFGGPSARRRSWARASSRFRWRRMNRAATRCHFSGSCSLSRRRFRARRHARHFLEKPSPIANPRTRHSLAFELTRLRTSRHGR